MYKKVGDDYELIEFKKLQLDDYQSATASTAVYPRAVILDSLAGLVYTTVGLAGESGEVLNKVKKVIRDNNGTLSEEVRQKLIDELGDIFWYLSQTATELSINLSEVATRNIEKLTRRKERGTIQGEGDNR